MIKRIKSLSQIWIFESFSGASCEFWEFTAFYGENTYWKSTLTKVFSSIWDDSIKQILETRTIPHNDWLAQKVVIKSIDTTTEDEISLGGSNWINNKLKGKIYTFNNDFIHEHLITWITTTHDNKEAFTDFILWEDAVKAINGIEEMKKALNATKVQIKVLKPPYLQNENSDKAILNFINMKISETSEELNNEKDKIKIQLKNLSSSNKILELPEIKEFTPEFIGKLEEILRKMNSINGRDFKSVTDSTLQNIQEHINNHTKPQETIDAWIKSWFLEHQKDGVCPFCWQDIKSVLLMQDFANFFNEEYEKFGILITKDLQISINCLFNEIKPEAYHYVNWVIQTIRQYYDYSNDLVISDELMKIIDELNASEERFSELFREEKEKIKGVCSDKKMAPHKSIWPILLGSDIIDQYKVLIEKTQGIYQKLLPLIGTIKDLRNTHKRLITTGSALEKKRLEDILKIIEIKIIRKEQDSQSKVYAGKYQEIIIMEKDIKKAEWELEESQSKYLETYFTTINKVYRHFWNRNFELIKKEWSKRGNRKTFFLSIRYKGKEISEAEFPKLMSESEKRSLAFAIFLARIDHLDMQKKSEAIIILDDPVVSFDQTRIDATAQYIRTSLTWVFRQVIILSHYKNFLKTIQEQYKNFPLSFYYEIERWWTYRACDREFFLQNNEALAFNKLKEFSDGTISTMEDWWLPRIFMEKYIDLVFQKQITESVLPKDSLSKRIDILPIEEEKRQRLHSYRIEFNEPHHDFTDSTELENFRTSVGNLLDVLYSL